MLFKTYLVQKERKNYSLYFNKQFLSRYFINKIIYFII